MIHVLKNQGLGVSEIARRTGLDLKTVRKYLRGGLQSARQGPRQPRPRLLDPFERNLREARPPTSLEDARPLELRTVVKGSREGKLWNEFIARYHYLGYKTLVGAQMRYIVMDRNGQPLAMIGFSTAVWRLALHDRHIGWTPTVHEKNLLLVGDNPRFLILPWIRIPNLGSHLLSHIRQRLPRDWAERYNVTPVLIETFVETPRYTGAVYRASRWTHVGTTQGRGRYYDRFKQSTIPKWTSGCAPSEKTGNAD